ncbi:MAG TPA: phage tail protein [Candidatus Tectomicrobia bacterium]
MNGPARDRLYDLLPAIYRVRDTTQGESLRALLAVLERELQLLEDDIARLYDNWFIETCDEWVVPYMGDLLGVRGLVALQNGAFSQRALVANTLAHRRRKGSAAMLEQLVRDATGWRARVVEFFETLVTTQHLNHVRSANVWSPDLRDTNQLELLGSPFDRVNHTADVRSIGKGRGKHNIPNVGLFVWRLQSYSVVRGTARAVSQPADGRYTFDPLGLDIPLFNPPQTERDITHLAEEINVPNPLRRRPLYDELEAQRRALVEGETPHNLYFGKQPVLQIFVNGQPDPVSPAEILICDLSDPPTPIPEGWRRPPTSRTYTRSDGTTVILPIQVAVDPVLGRLAFPAGVAPSQVQVSYAYGFSADVGGGPYDRRESVSEALTRPVTWQVGVSKDLAPVLGELVANLAEAVQEWNAKPPGTVGVIAILDSHTYVENLTGADKIIIPEGSHLLIVAADWPEVDVPGSPGLKQRIAGQLAPVGLRPHLLGDLSVQGDAAESSLSPGELVLDGLLIEGGLRVLVGNLGSLRVAHCTLVPHKGGPTVNPSVTPGQQNTGLSIKISRSICGPITLPDTVPTLHIVDSIVDLDQAEDEAITAPGAAASLQTSTVLGSTTVRGLEASNSIFTGVVSAERRQTGCVRFSYVPDGSRTPRRFRCQPDLALKEATDPVQQARTRARLRPVFTSVRYGHPGYAQLTLTCAEQIRMGAEDGSEMGVFNGLKQRQREANLGLQLEDHLRFGLEAGIFYVT